MDTARKNLRLGRVGLAARMRRLALPLVLGGVAASAGLGWVLAQDGAAPRPPALAAQEPALPIKTHVKSSTITLPIEIPEPARALLQEVHIFVKEGAHSPWVLKDRVAPTQTTYTFRAPKDGEYWFKLGIVDRGGRSNIEDIERAAADTIVVVTSTPSLVDVRTLGETAEGLIVQVMLQPGASETGAVKFQYQTGNQKWHPLDAMPNQADKFCIPANAVLSGMVRVTAMDANGNALPREFNLNQLRANNNPPPQLPPEILKTGYNPSKFTGPEMPAPQTILVDPQETISLNPVPKQPAKGPTTLPGNGGIKIITEPAVADKVATPSERVEVITHKGSPSIIPNQNPGAPPLVDSIIHRPEGSKPPVPELLPVPDKNQGQAQIISSRPRGPVAPNRHLVSNSRVVLDYQLDQVGVSGVGRVDIYMTRDNGQNWVKIGEDPDKKSPVELNLPGEGLYGISLAVSNGRGFGGQPPQAGDTPDWWVEVDSVKPKAEITAVRPGADAEDSAAIYIYWTAKDKNLAGEPIDLFHAATREGPWLPIAKGVRNDGQYRWQPGRDVGAHAFIRVAVHDRAGNTAVAETEQPVALDDMSRPRARPLGVITTPMTPPVVNSDN